MFSLTLTKLSYSAYAVGFFGAAVSWSLSLAQWLMYRKADAAVPGELWQSLHQTMGRLSGSVLVCSSVAVLLGFILAVPSATETSSIAQSHRSFLLRLAPVAVLCLILVGLANGRMGSLDADWTSLLILLWFGWLLASAWGAHLRQAEVTGPFGWQLVLVIDLVASGFFVWFLCCFRMTRLF